MEQSRTAVLAAIFTIALATLAVGPAVGTPSLWVNVDPEGLEHGDTSQSIEVLVEGVDGPTSFVLDVTSLAEAGVDLSGMGVEVDRPVEPRVDATVLRTDGDVLVRVALDPGEDATTGQVAFGMTLTGLDTANASHARLDYGVRYGNETAETRTFDLRDPELPWVGSLTRTERAITSRSNATQVTRIQLVDVPAVEGATVRVDLSAATARGVSLADARLTARLLEPDTGGELRRVALNGSTVELGLRTERRTDVTVELALRGLDTRGADPATDLRYGVTFESPAGSVSGTTEPFGLYAPGETPTRTPSPECCLTTTPPGTGTTDTDPAGTASPTPAPSPAGTTGDGRGFGVPAVLVALVSLLLLARTPPS